MTRTLSYFTPEDYGAIGDGVSDDTLAVTQAINAALQAVTNTGNYGTTRRFQQFPVALSKIYRVTSDIPVRSARGLRIVGNGPYSSGLLASGSGFTSAVLAGDGLFKCSLEGFGITGDGTESAAGNPIPSALSVTKSASTLENTSQSIISNVVVGTFNWATGILSGAASGTLQDDGHTFTECLVQGGNPAGSQDAAKWLTGYQFGNGNSGNQYNYVARNCGMTGCKNGVQALATGFWWRGGEPANNGTDFQVYALAPVKIEGVQSQSAGRFMQQATGGSALSGPVSVENIMFKPGTNIAADGKWIDLESSAKMVKLDSVYCISGSTAPIIFVSSTTTPMAVTLINVAQNNTYAAGVSVTSNGGANSTQRTLNYVQMNNSGQVTAITADDTKTGL